MNRVGKRVKEENEKFADEISKIGQDQYKSALEDAQARIKEDLEGYKDSVETTVAKSVIDILKERGIGNVVNKGKKVDRSEAAVNKVTEDYNNLSEEKKKEIREMADSDPDMKMTKEKLLALIDRVKDHPKDSRMRKIVDNLVNGPIGRDLLGIKGEDDVDQVKASVQHNKSWEEAVEVIKKQLLDPNLKRDSLISITIETSSSNELEIKFEASKYSPSDPKKSKEEEPPIKLTGLNIDKDGNIIPSE